MIIRVFIVLVWLVALVAIGDTVFHRGAQTAGASVTSLVGTFTVAQPQQVAQTQEIKPVQVVPLPVSEGGPTLCPVASVAGRVVMTQGYGVGSHAPAATWGAVDLAVDGNGDGSADPQGTQGQPVVATHDGQVRVTLNSHPAGNHVWVIHEDGVWRTGYAHLLSNIPVETGQLVRAGETIGYVGSTGMSSGPHLDYQVWKSGVNVDPTPLIDSCWAVQP